MRSKNNIKNVKQGMRKWNVREKKEQYEMFLKYVKTKCESVTQKYVKVNINGQFWRLHKWKQNWT